MKGKKMIHKPTICDDIRSKINADFLTVLKRKVAESNETVFIGPISLIGIEKHLSIFFSEKKLYYASNYFADMNSMYPAIIFFLIDSVQKLKYENCHSKISENVTIVIVTDEPAKYSGEGVLVMTIEFFEEMVCKIPRK